MADAVKFEGWAIVELMGHVRRAGYIAETTLAGAGVLRLDVPAQGDEPAVTQFISPSALYCLTPVSEEIARAVAARTRPAPVASWEMPRTALNPQPPIEAGAGACACGHSWDEDGDCLRCDATRCQFAPVGEEDAPAWSCDRAAAPDELLCAEHVLLSESVE